MITITKNSKIVRKSKNLRCILDYARLYPVTKVTVIGSRLPNDYGTPLANVTFHFYDGATSFVNFVSYHVACSWVLSRRSWGKPTDDNNAMFPNERIFTY